MYSASCTTSRCLVLSNSRRGVTHESTRSSTSKQTRSYHASSQSAKRSYRSCGAFAAAASAGTSCAMCHSIRLTSACSTSSMLQYRGLHTSSSSTNNAPASLTAGANNRGPSCFGNGLGLSASSNPAGPMMSRAKQLSTRANATSFGPSTVSSNQIGAFHSASRANMAISAPLLIGGGQSAIQQLGSVEQLGGNVEEIISSAWGSRAGAVIFAAAAAGSIFLNPI